MSKKPLFLYFVLFLLSTISVAQNQIPSIGEIQVLKGDANFMRGGKQFEAKKGSAVFSGDKIVTGKSSFIKLKMQDNTTITLAAESEMSFENYSPKGKQRKNIVELLKGKMRSAVRQKVQGEESIVFKTPTVSIAVRGTEFMLNSYKSAGSAVSDFALIEGKVSADISKLNIPIKTFDVAEGQYFNTGKIAKDMGLQSMKTLGKEAMNKLMEADSFFPNLMDKAGNFTTPAQALGLVAAVGGMVGAGIANAAANLASGAANMVGGSDDDKNEKTDQAKEVVREKVIIKEKVIKIVEKEKKPDPEDIRTAKELREKYLKENRCFYWIYKKLPGAGQPERFRRERDCDEYEFDL